jgi:hypothetical protein
MTLDYPHSRFLSALSRFMFTYLCLHPIAASPRNGFLLVVPFPLSFWLGVYSYELLSWQR